MNGASSNVGGGLSFPGALTIAFIVLKLCEVIAWSWVWVLSPLWISAAIAMLVVALLPVAYAIWRAVR